MQTVDALTRQIGTAEDLATVVRTMKTLAAVNIRQYEAAADSLQVYDASIRTAARMLVWNAPRWTGQRRQQTHGRTGVVAFGSDQGMCGGFNEAVAGHIDLLVENGVIHGEVPVMALGRRLISRLEDRGRTVSPGPDLPGTAGGITSTVQQLLPRLDAWRTAHRLNAVHVCHNSRIAQTGYEPTQQPLLPVAPDALAGPRPARWSGRSLPLITMRSEALWENIARQYLFVSLFHACAESQASENAARIAAMQAAETHIDERLSQLNHAFQQLRQTSITEELLDVITGFEAITATRPRNHETVMP